MNNSDPRIQFSDSDNTAIYEDLSILSDMPFDDTLIEQDIVFVVLRLLKHDLGNTNVVVIGVFKTYDKALHQLTEYITTHRYFNRINYDVNPYFMYGYESCNESIAIYKSILYIVI